MSVKIRLQLGGAKKRAVYRIVVADSRFKRDGRFLEKLGTFFPMIQDPEKKLLIPSQERIRYWIEKGAQFTKKVQEILTPILSLQSTSQNPTVEIKK
jgi:small subunit ribosomal protein S16